MDAVNELPHPNSYCLSVAADHIQYQNKKHVILYVYHEQMKRTARPSSSSNPIPAAAAASQVFSAGIQHVSHTLVAAPALPRDTSLNGPVYLTVCPYNLLSLCMGLFGAGCGYTGY